MSRAAAVLVAATLFAAWHIFQHVTFAHDALELAGGLAVDCTSGEGRTLMYRGRGSPCAADPRRCYVSGQRIQAIARANGPMLPRADR